MIETMTELKRLTDNLPPFNVLLNRSVDSVQLEVDNGMCFSFGILKNDMVAVAKTVITKGATLTEHYHPEQEYIICYKGNVEINVGGEVNLLLVSDYLVIPPDTPHTAKAISDCELIVITIPASINFPNDGRPL